MEIENNQQVEEINTETILHCGNPKCSNTFKKSPRRKYCCDKCRAKHGFSLRYIELRNNPVYKEKNKIKSINYYNKHKERLQPKMREYGKLRYQQLKSKKEEEKPDGNSQS